jgi:hypothetical protein
MEKKIKLHGGKDDTYAWRKKEKTLQKITGISFLHYIH